eukprot:ANDGO_07913.mRNA.1 hypothetical protein
MYVDPSRDSARVSLLSSSSTSESATESESRSGSSSLSLALGTVRERSVSHPLRATASVYRDIWFMPVNDLQDLGHMLSTTRKLPRRTVSVVPDDGPFPFRVFDVTDGSPAEERKLALIMLCTGFLFPPIAAVNVLLSLSSPSPVRRTSAVFSAIYLVSLLLLLLFFVFDVN